MMVMVPEIEGFRRSEVLLHHLPVAGGMMYHGTTLADTLIRLNMRTSRHLLQFDLYRLAALLALKREETGWFIAHIVVE
jgi:hypothetical protein